MIEKYKLSKRTVRDSTDNETGQFIRRYFARLTENTTSAKDLLGANDCRLKVYSSVYYVFI